MIFKVMIHLRCQSYLLYLPYLIIETVTVSLKIIKTDYYTIYKEEFFFPWSILKYTNKLHFVPSPPAG